MDTAVNTLISGGGAVPAAAPGTAASLLRVTVAGRRAARRGTAFNELLLSHKAGKWRHGGGHLIVGQLGGV